MYLRKVEIANSGPLIDLTITPGFKADGSPKPLVLVGGNGSGKTSLLSLVADALIEFAARSYQDIMPTSANGRQFYRMLGGGSTSLGQAFAVAALSFGDGDHTLTYCERSGGAAPEEMGSRFDSMALSGNWRGEGNRKFVNAPDALVQRIFPSGCYAFFPSNRSEVPYWLNSSVNLGDSAVVQFDRQITNNLRKPIVVANAFDSLKPWLADVILDQSIDSATFSQALVGADRAAMLNRVRDVMENATTLNGLVAILRVVLKDPTARLGRTGRRAAHRKIMILNAASVLAPSLESLSAGQGSLLAIFGTVLRYGDTGPTSKPISDIEGIALIDEIDVHLHADLQHEVLPKLIQMFPRVQFVVTSHSPLFLMGMDSLVGEDGYDLIELPRGERISVERFAEFKNSLKYFEATKAFEDRVGKIASDAGRPLVLFEGETDPIYVRAAVEVLGIESLRNVDFDWVGRKGTEGAIGGGKSNLDDAFKVLRNNPGMVHAPIALMYDCDTEKAPAIHGRLVIRSFPRNLGNAACQSGIENLLPAEEFDARFYQSTEKRTADIVTVQRLRKAELCQHLCAAPLRPEVFAQFRAPLEELGAALAAV